MIRKLTIILGVLQLAALPVAAQPPQADWLEGTAESWIDIERDYGCRSIDESPGFNNAPLLNQCFEDAGRRHFARIVFPGKAYRIDDTVRIPDRTAIAVVGSSGEFAPANRIDPANQREDRQPEGPAASQLVWFGPPDKAMVEYNGYGMYWSGVSLVGRPAQADRGQSARDRASIGMLIRKPHAGIGTGKLYIRRMYVGDCKNGVQFGVDEHDQNADTGLFGYFTAENCDAGICVKHHMGLGFIVQSYRQISTETAFRFDFGGRLHCHHLRLMTPGTVLSLGKPRIGGASYHIDDLVVENGALARDGFRLVEMDQPSPAMICLSGQLPRRRYDYAIALLKGSAALTLRDVSNLRAGAIVCKPAYVAATSNNRRVRKLVGPHVRMDGCRLLDVSEPQQIIARQASGRKWSMSWSGCVDQRGRPYPDGIDGQPAAVNRR